MKNDLVLRVVAKLLMPFILLFALYVQFHGDFGPGGGFQAGVILAAAVIFYGLIFGLTDARKAGARALVESMMAVGVLIYGGVGVAGLLLGGNYLDYFVLDPEPRARPAPRHLLGRGGRGDHRVGRDAEDLLHVRRPRQGGRMTGTGTPMSLAGHFTYFVTVFLMIAGLFIVIARGNLIKKLVGLGIFQTSVYLLYIAPGKLVGGTAPILSDAFTVYSNPLPHVLILTAIVVGVATLALGLALVVRIREAYGSIEEDEILRRTRTRAVPNRRHEPGPASACAAGRRAFARGAADGAAAPPQRGVRGGAGSQLGGAGDRAAAVAAGGRRRHDLLRHRQLAAAVGHRVPRRHTQRLRAGAGRRHRGRGAAVQPRQHRGRGAATAALPLLHDVRAVPDRPAGHHDHRRCIQHLRVPGDLVAVDLRADRAGARPPRPGGRRTST